MPNPLLRDRTVEFVLYEILGAERLCALPAYREHSRETFDMYLEACRSFARDVLFPTYRALDERAPKLEDGRIKVHPLMQSLYPKLAGLGILNATRPEAVEGQMLPTVVANLAAAYLMAGNLSAYAYVGLTTSAARIIESFGSDALRRDFMARMYSGEWTGTMALTEPQAGSSLADVQTRATKTDAGHYLIRGAKIFISGADQDFTENVVNMTLARIDDAPKGVKGISLFVVPNLRNQGGKLVPNDTATAGMIHKIGWRGIPSVALNLGDNGDCHGYLVGEPNRGLSYMFQMMNEARLMVGFNGIATATVAYHEALEYAKTRPQGRPAKNKNPDAPQVAIVEHADVRRMLLRQKAITEGGLTLLAYASLAQDLAEHGESEDVRRDHRLLLELLTPVAKSFPAEKGFESNSLAVQVHGGYGYSSEYLPEAWLRDQKLNSLHEGTTGVQSLDLLGRKVSLEGGATLEVMAREIGKTIEAARAAGVDGTWCDAVAHATETVVSLTGHLARLGSPDATLLHSADYLDLFGTLVVAWMWLKASAVAKPALASGKDREFYEGELCAAQYWIHTEVPRIEVLAALCRSGEDSYQKVQPDWL
jgi:alkylation response protein AidB-like acyl-CoA dehydrogenase